MNTQPGKTSHVYHYALGMSVVLFTTVYSYLSIKRWSLFLCQGYDYGIIDSAAFNTSVGHFMLSNNQQEIVFWSLHFSPILLVFSLYYLLAGDGFWFMFIFQSLTVGLAAVPVFLLGKHYLKDEAAALFMAIFYLSSQYIGSALLFDYHMTSHLGLTVLSAFYCMVTGRWRLFWVWFALTLSLQEDAAIGTFMMGLYAAVIMRKPRHGAAIMALSAAYIGIVFLVGIPYFRSISPEDPFSMKKYVFGTAYSWLGDSFSQIAWNFASRPVWMLSQVFSAANPQMGISRQMAWSSFADHFLYLPFFSPVTFLTFLAVSMELFLNNWWGRYALMYHYPFLVFPYWTLASIAGLANIQKGIAYASSHFPPKGARLFPLFNYPLVPLICVYMAIIIYFLSFGTFDATILGVRTYITDLDKPSIMLTALLCVFVMVNPSVWSGAGLPVKVVRMVIMLMIIGNLHAAVYSPLKMTSELGRGLLSQISILFDEKLDERAARVRANLGHIPRFARVAAGQGVYTHLHHNPNAHYFTGADEYPFGRQPVDFIVFDSKSQNEEHFYKLDLPYEAKKIFFKRAFGLLLADDGLFIFKAGLPKRKDLEQLKKSYFTFPANGLPAAGQAPATPDKTSPTGYSRAARPGSMKSGDHIVYGPYIALDHGAYTAVFNMKIEESATGPVVELDVVCDEGRKSLGKVVITAQMFAGESRWADFRLPFTISEKEVAGVEMRVRYLGGATVLISQTSVDLAWDDFNSMLD